MRGRRAEHKTLDYYLERGMMNQKVVDCHICGTVMKGGRSSVYVRVDNRPTCRACNYDLTHRRQENRKKKERTEEVAVPLC